MREEILKIIASVERKGPANATDAILRCIRKRVKVRRIPRGHESATFRNAYNFAIDDVIAELNAAMAGESQ